MVKKKPKINFVDLWRLPPTKQVIEFKSSVSWARDTEFPYKQAKDVYLSL